MPLSNDLISQFVKITKDKTKDTSETVVYGTVQDSKAPNGLNYVKIDGSDLLTPVLATTVISPDDRVTIMIKNHSAVVTGNLTSPAPRVGDTLDIRTLNAQIARIDTLETVDTEIQGKLTANIADINSLKTNTATISGTLDAAKADITTLKADTATINKKLTAAEADIDDLQANTLTAAQIEATYATIENLNVEKARIDVLESTIVTTEVLSATYATITSLNTEKGRIDTLETEKLSAADIEGKYANIDFSNISKATMGQFYANSGLIQNVVVGDSTITGKLVGVTISGDLIEGNTVKAEKLVIKGTDGLYYKLNTDGVTTEAQQTNQNSLDGSVIKAKSITATKINVTDLVAFGATIGGFAITDSALYSGTKASAVNTTRGIYLGKDAQAAIGDGTSYIKYYKDSNGNYKLAISADSIDLTSGTNVQTQINAAKSAAEAAQTDADALKTRMTSAETSITQNSEQIALRATKTEVSNAKSEAISTAATAQTTANTALARTTVKDTRETNETPGWYMTNYPKQTVVEFKKCTAVGLSGHTYCSLETVVPWNDKSGSYPKQTATVNEKQYWRTGSSDTTWGSWMAASETATNFISFNTTDGVLIGNKTSGTWSGTRAQITSSAFNILDSSGTTLASYGATTLIGKTAGNNLYIDNDGLYIRKNSKVLVTVDQYGLKIANTNDSSGSLGSGATKPALVIGTPTGYHIEMDNNEIMAESNATTSSHLFLNMEGGNVSINNNASRALMFQDGALYAKNASYYNGDYLGIIDALNDNGNTTFGYGGYINSIGETKIYGNNVSINSNSNLDVEASWINCRSIAPNANATYALGTYGEKGWSNIYLGKGDGKTNALHIISGSSTYTLCGVNSSGQYIFGNNAAVMYYQVKNVSETATGNAFKVTSGNNAAANNTSSVWLFGAADATSRYIGSYLTYNRTYSSTANMVVTSNGIFGRSTSSSQRYKKDISIAGIDDLRGLYDLPVKKFKYKEDYIAADDELYDKPLYGFIVEDLEDVLPCAVQHEKDEDGKTIPEMWNSNIIVPALLKLIQDLNTRLKTLEERENQ